MMNCMMKYVMGLECHIEYGVAYVYIYIVNTMGGVIYIVNSMGSICAVYLSKIVKWENG